MSVKSLSIQKMPHIYVRHFLYGKTFLFKQQSNIINVEV